jgi:uncharacterized protein (TIGR02145 family)
MKLKTCNIKPLFTLFFLAGLPLVQTGCRQERVGLPVVTTLPVTEITTNSVQSGGVITDDGGTEIISKGLIFGRDSDLSLYRNLGITRMGGNKEDFTAIVTGLLPGHPYFIRAFATSGEGTGYGNRLQFSTEIRPCPDIPTVTDIDGNVYNTVLIGNQCWMRENLKTTTYRNGTPIEFPESNNAAWQSNTTGAYAWYENNVVWKNSYGALYNWYAINNPAGICPEGWYVPDYSDWAALTSFIGGASSPSGNKLKSCQQMDSPQEGDCNTTEHPYWKAHNTQYGTDDYTFSALPGGFRFYDGTFKNLGETGIWWSSGEHLVNTSWARQLSYQNGSISTYFYNKRQGFSVRCLKE